MGGTRVVAGCLLSVCMHCGQVGEMQHLAKAMYMQWAALPSYNL